MLKALFTWLGLSLCTLGYLGTTNNPVLAQVTSDGTVNTQVNEDGNTAEITGGETKGDNLFHSFQDFSVGTGNEAFFNNADSISNIFSRVTGGNVSAIDGAIRANGSANLFLINPAGIIFGEGASLNLGGSFYGSSASSILFEDGEFSATDLDNPPLLTVNAPIGLGFRDQPGDITNNSVANNGSGLEVDSGKNISLLGGDVSFNGGRVTAPGGIINLGGLSTAGEINIDANNNLSFADEIVQSNVSLSDNAVVDVTSDGGGLITVNANNLKFTEESLFLANIGEGLGSENAVAGKIEVNSNSFSADKNSLIHSDNLGTGQAGTININTDTLNLTDGSAITATTFGVGDAGTINVTAQNITLDQEFTGIYSNVGLTNIASESLDLNVDGVVGNGGVINVDTDTLSLTNGARIISTSIAQGNGGAVNINATGAISFIGQGNTPIPAFGGKADNVVISGSFSQVQQDTGNGNAGEVNITADSLTLINKGAVLVDNSGVGGDAGDINLNIKNNISLDQGALILAQVQPGATGNGGDINITAGSLEAQDNSQISADTKGQGDAGNITLNVEKAVTLDTGSFILTEVKENTRGNAGDIGITANALVVQNGANITAKTGGQGDAGKITVMTNGVTNTVSLSNGGKIISTVEDGAAGKGGNISLTSGELNLTNNSEIVADTAGDGNAGNIKIDINGGDINLDNSNQIQSQTRGDATGDAGNIDIRTNGSLFSTNGNLILADSQARGNGGNITITVGEKILLEGFSKDPQPFSSQIVAGLTRENAKGIGGTVEINAGELVLDDVAFISSNTATNSVGAAGAITINADSLRLMNNSFINAFTANNDVAGAITINAQTLNLSSGGKILAVTDGKGDAGNINLNVSGDIQINNSIESSAQFDFYAVSPSRSSQLLNDLQDLSGGVYANATGNVKGSGGNIFIDSNSLSLKGGAIISSSTNSGQGGNLTIDSNFIVAFPNQNNDIIADAKQGTGGNITINAESVFGIEERSLNDSTNDINASSEFDLDGTVNINTSDINPIQGAIELPSNVVEPTQTTAQTCSVNREGKANNGLAIAGRGGVHPTPDAPLNSENISNENPVQATIPQPLETSQGKIQPAMGIKVTESGRIVLTAYRTNNAGERIPNIRPNCN